MEEKDESFNVCPHCGYVEGTAPKEIYHITPGEVLHGKYIVGRVLGYGGFGITYIGWDYTLNRKVAIKEFLPSEFATRMPGETMITVYNGEATVQFEAGLERFIEEAQRLAKFNSVGSIVDIYDTFIENNTGYIVMQCLEGDTVKDLLKKNGVMPYESAKLIIVEILKTLSVVHKEGIIHRDISPDNIFITNDNKIKLLDFGAARYASGFHSKSLSVILKPGYAPEEQYRSHGNQGPWSDVYATAATLYKMITGITIEESMERTVKDNVKSPAELGVVIPEGANTAIMNALNIHAELRTQSADDFINELGSNEVVRIIDKPNKSDAGRIPLWLKITAASVLSVAIILISLVATGVIDISAIVSMGTVADESTRVPYVINEMMGEGEKLLNDDGFGMQITDQAYDEFAAKDIIKSQTPVSGKIAAECTEYDDRGRPIVFVVVSGGHAPVVVPNVLGLMRDEAEKILKGLGFEVSFEEEYSSTDPVGAVLLQDIMDMEYAYGSTIILTVSKGEMQVDASKTHAIPNLVGLSYEQASKKLMAIGMYANRVERSSTTKENQVLEQDVASGTEMPEGTTVTLVVSSNTIVIPNVVYKEEATARALITQAGAKVKVKYEKNEQVRSGNVISQSIVGKSTAGTTVTLVVSTGFDKAEDVKKNNNDAEKQKVAEEAAKKAAEEKAAADKAAKAAEEKAAADKAAKAAEEKAAADKAAKKAAEEAAAKKAAEEAAAAKKAADEAAARKAAEEAAARSAAEKAALEELEKNKKKMVTVPKLVGMQVGTNYSTVFNQIASRYPELNDLSVTFVPDSNESFLPGTITRTNPGTGSVLSWGSMLTIYIAQ